MRSNLKENISQLSRIKCYARVAVRKPRNKTSALTWSSLWRIFLKNRNFGMTTAAPRRSDFAHQKSRHSNIGCYLSKVCTWHKSTCGAQECLRILRACGRRRILPVDAKTCHVGGTEGLGKIRKHRVQGGSWRARRVECFHGKIDLIFVKVRLVGGRKGAANCGPAGKTHPRNQSTVSRRYSGSLSSLENYYCPFTNYRNSISSRDRILHHIALWEQTWLPKIWSAEVLPVLPSCCSGGLGNFLRAPTQGGSFLTAPPAHRSILGNPIFCL